MIDIFSREGRVYCRCDLAILNGSELAYHPAAFGIMVYSPLCQNNCTY